MTTYTLPDGTEVPTASGHTPYPDPATWVHHPTLGWIMIGRDKLTEVPPPLPTEPEEGSFALVQIGEGDDYHREVWERQAGEWWRVGARVAKRIGLDWEELHQRGTVTVLIPDPADTAPTLPFCRSVGDGRQIAVERSAIPGHVYVEADNADVDVSLLGDFVAALALAVRQAREAQFRSAITQADAEIRAVQRNMPVPLAGDRP
jgi:hypothetical protein